MSVIDNALLQIGYLETLARRETFIHRLDPRAKLLTTLVFVVTVVSFGKYEITGLIPFAVFPAVLISLGDLPPLYLARKLLWAAPFVLFIGLFNPLLDREILLRIGSLEITGGWVSFGSLVLRSALTLGAALILVATTGFTAVCGAMERLGSPRIFAVLLLFIYRYLFVLVEEALRMMRARALRTFGKKGLGLKIWGSMVGNLLLRTLDRAERIHTAMLARGFDGEIRMTRPMKFGKPEILFTVGWSGLFIFLRFVNLPRLIGNLIVGGPA